MTTIIVVSIVALVYFVTLSVVAFMVWKRESEMRTDSIKAIEHEINEMAYELAGINLVNQKRERRISRENDECDDRSRMNTDNDLIDLRKVNARAEDTVTVFRPVEGQNRKLRWTEVSEETVHEEVMAEPESPQPALVQGSGPGDSIVEGEEQNDRKTETPTESINLSFIDLESLDSFDDVDLFESTEKVLSDYDTGRSGRKYTAEELESLIKE